MRDLYKWPLWLAQVPTWTKSFRKNPIIGSPILNRLGLHVARVVACELLFRGRLLVLSPLVSSADRRRFLDDGYLLKRDFLPEAEFRALAEEVRSFRGEIRERLEGDTVTQRAFLPHAVRRRFPRIDAFFRNTELTRLMRYVSSKNRLPLFFIESLRQHGAKTSRHDSQKDLHTDTFHPCVKAWLYLDDVTERNGAFTFVPGSHRLTVARLRWEYRESLRASAERHRGDRYWDGSFRLEDTDRERLGFEPPVGLEVPANTLLIANVRGFHCRGEASEPSRRLSLWMQLRDNPFVPALSPAPQLGARLFETVWSQVLRAEDLADERRANRRKFVGTFDDHAT